jgi:preprotein translocase subunit SecF
MQLFKKTKFDFLSRRRYAYFLSAALFIVGIASLIIRGGLNLGIDFKGGTQIILRFEEPVATQMLREALARANLGTSDIHKFGADNEFAIYVAQQRGITAASVTEKVENAIRDAYPDKHFEERMVDSVGPKIGEELRKKAILAVLIALLLMLIYIGWRFELVFAIGAIIALFHDVLIALGIFNLLNFQISLKEIAAFLTIVGYSINDTIVIYDRIRENLKTLRSDELETIMNKSINQSLSRTVITSGTTFFVVFVLFLFGGEVMRGFSFVMLIGVIVGTYSSIFVASPVVLEWQMRHGGRRQLKMSKKKL